MSSYPPSSTALTELPTEIANDVLGRIRAIEENQRLLEAEIEGNHREMEEERARLVEAELAAKRGERVASTMRAHSAAETVWASGIKDESREVPVDASIGDQVLLTKTVRVALDDVESAMMAHPAVQTARAFGKKDERFGEEVFCAIVPKRGARVSEPWLKLHAQSTLPAPMVPKKFYYVKEMPFGLSRKELADSDVLKDLKYFSGFSEVKHVKGPSWGWAKQKLKIRH